MLNVKNLVLGIGIVIVYALVLWQGIEAFYPSPQYDDFCTPGRFESFVPVKPDLRTAPNCTFPKELQDKQNQCFGEGGQPILEYDENGCAIDVKTCDFCNKEFEEARDRYSRNVFIISIIIGIITLIIGYSILSIEPVGSALMGSGVWAIFFGAAINWRNFSNFWRFLLLFIALIVIIWIAYRINVKKLGNKI